MKTLYLYLMRQVLATLGMAVVVFTFVLLLGNVLKEILALLVNRQATLEIVLHAVILLIPFVLAFALPMGLLTAALLVFGRFSADQELTAVRANGISLVALITPILLLSVLLSGLCAWINTQVAQQCRVAYKDLLFSLGRQQPTSVLVEGRFMSEFPGYLIYVGKKRGDQLEDILLAQFQSDQVIRRIRADKGEVSVDLENQQLSLQLTNVSWAEYDTNHGIWLPLKNNSMPLTIDLKTISDTRESLHYSDMTITQLFAEKQKLERFNYLSRPIDKMSPEQLHRELKLIGQMKEDMLMPVTVQIHRQAAFSFACISFTLVGIPLGIRAHRRETSIGIGLAIVLVLIYYSFIILGQALETRAELAPHLLLWLPNFIFQAVGAVLLWRVNRGL